MFAFHLFFSGECEHGVATTPMFDSNELACSVQWPCPESRVGPLHKMCPTLKQLERVCSTPNQFLEVEMRKTQDKQACHCVFLPPLREITQLGFRVGNRGWKRSVIGRDFVRVAVDLDAELFEPAIERWAGTAKDLRTSFHVT